MVAEEHITAFGWATPADLDDMMSLALRVNDYLWRPVSWASASGWSNFKVEFGRVYNEMGDMRIILADEISPDNCRLWDVKTGEKLDKDRFREDLGKVEDAYREVARRLGILPEGGVVDLQGRRRTPLSDKHRRRRRPAWAPATRPRGRPNRGKSCTEDRAARDGPPAPSLPFCPSPFPFPHPRRKARQTRESDRAHHPSSPACSTPRARRSATR